MRKYITKASERIGVESTSRDGKRAQVVSYSTCENFIIRFCDGKEMKLKNWRYFIEGNFNYEKHFKAPRNREERIGEKKVMNNGLTAEVIEYRGSHDMDILFEDGGKRTGVSWRDFCIGNIAHPTIHGGNVSQNELVLRFYLESLGFVRIPQRSKRSDRVGLEGLFLFMRIFVTTRQSPNFIYSKYIEKFASKYKLYLPTKEELKAEIETQKAMFYL